MVFALVGVAGLLGVVAGVLGWRRYWVVRDTPTSKCAAVFVGRNEVVGEARPERRLMAPITGEACVWFEWLLEHYVETTDDKGNRSGHWKDVARRKSHAPFWVVDDTGGVLVWPEGAKLDAPRTFHDRAHRSQVPYSLAELRVMTDEGEIPAGDTEPEHHSGFLGFVKDLFDGIEHDALGTLGRDYRVSEWRIDAGQPLYVLGHATMRDDAVALQFTREAGSLLVTNRSESSVAIGSLAMTVGGLLLGAAMAGVGGYLGAAVLGAGAAVAAYGAFVGVLYASRLYNRLVVVKEQAATAWSLIDVALRRRHDLLPNLVSVAKRYAGHESDVLAAAAGARLPEQESLPSDATLEQAAETNDAQRSSSRSLLALAESYPDLKADEVFRDLATRMVDLENQVAYARAFYNDAVTVLRDRRGAFPGNLLARYVTTPSWALFDADDSETFVPSMTPLLDAPSR